MGYLYFTLATLPIILIVCAFIYFNRVKGNPKPRLSKKPKTPVDREQPRGKILAAGRDSLKGGKYVPSYQNDPEATRSIQRFLSGAVIRNDNSIAETPDTAGEDKADDSLLSNQGPEQPAGENDERETIKAQDPVQLELGMRHRG